jgi:hypothetical protein
MRTCLEQALVEAAPIVVAREEMRQLAAAGSFVPTIQEVSSLPDNVREACEHLVTKGTETCRLVALTVIAGAAADPYVRPDIIQENAGGSDFRSLYKVAIRPVLRRAATQASVRWEPSADPFVSNPFREGRIDDDWVTRRKNKLPGAPSLLTVVHHVAVASAQARPVLLELAVHEVERLARLQVNYRIPPRLTTAIVAQLIDHWLKGGAGGRRLESASIAMLRFAGKQLIDGWEEVESHHVNDPRPYDALCRAHGTVCAVGEAKDQPVKLIYVEQLAKEMASHRAIRGYIFTQETWWPSHDETERAVIEAFVRDRSIIGLRIDIIDIMEAVRVWLALADQDDAALPNFLRVLADELDQHALLEDRRVFADLLGAI